MRRESYQRPIGDRIRAYGAGSVFTATDFLDIAPTSAINEALHRMTANGQISRILTGVYYVPKYSDLLGEYLPPRIDLVADALSRKYNWSIAPSGETALNLLRLTTQVPNTWTYVSDGPYKSYEIGRYRLRFKNIKTRHIAGLSKNTIMVIQALKTLGKDTVSREHIEIIRKELNAEDKQTLLKESQTTTRWIYEIIREICGEESR